ncbi:MAG: flagellar protein FlaG [Treponema sp.]|jgi:flagellar protein FlaG|nr:flagellar protein FlaG [Treponema sp.]
MSIQIAVAGNGLPQQELGQDLTRNNVRASEHKAAFVEQLKASLPGNHRPLPVESVMADLEKVTLAFNKKLKFVVDHQSHEVTVKVIDPETDKVIKVLPPEELQRLHSRIKETLGFMFDERI